MALCLASSLVEKDGFDATDQVQRYVRWHQEGYWSATGRCFDIGSTTARALARFKATGNPLAGSTDPRSAGNGSIMRLAPVPMFFARDLAKATHYSAESSQTTHAAVECLDACRLFGAMLVRALQGAGKEDVLLGDARTFSVRRPSRPLRGCVSGKGGECHPRVRVRCGEPGGRTLVLSSN